MVDRYPHEYSWHSVPLGRAPRRPSRVPSPRHVSSPTEASHSCPCMPSLGIVPGTERPTDARLLRGSPGRWIDKRAPNECAFPPLDMRVQAIQLSPYRSGVAGPQHTRLLLSPAFQPCACPLALSGPGQAVASESSALNSGPFWRQFTPCVTRRTLSPHPAQHLGSFLDVIQTIEHL